MAYAKSEAMHPIPLIKAAVQLDLLEIGKEYTAIVVLRAGKIRSRPFVVLGCYPDYYSIRDLTNGRVETLRKSDIHCGIIKIEGLNIKEKVLEAVEDLKTKEEEKMKMTQEIMKKLVEEGYQWILKNPGKPYFTNDKLSEALNYPQKQKVLDEIWGALVYEGYENLVETVTGKRGTKGLVYNPFDTIKGVDPEPVKIEDAKPEPIKAEELLIKRELLRVDGLKDVTDQMFYSVASTFNLLKLTGKDVVLDIVFREV